MRSTAMRPWLSATALLVGIASTSGCQLVGIDLKGVEDAFTALTDPLVAQAIVLGTEEPEIDALQPLMDLGLIEPGVTIQVYLANAASAADIESAPLSSARVVLETPDDAYGVESLGSGAYALGVAAAIPYVEEQEWTVWADAGREEASWIDLILPQAAELNLPKHHDADKALDLDLTGQGYNSATVFVYDPLGVPTWGNYPTSITDLYNRSLATDQLTTLTIPAEAFPKPGLYAIGFAGMVHNSDEQLDGVNKLLSRGMSGKTTFVTLDVW